MREVTIIADDLTGAADTGIAFAVAGLPTYVSFGGDARSSPIVAVDTDSRSLPATAAAERAFAATRAAYRDGTRTVYKKIDSTLRGNVGVEVAATFRAAAEAVRRVVAIVAPAFPATGRTVRGGRVLVNGVPLETTEVWRTSGTQGTADLRAMLSASGLRAGNARPGEPLPADAQAIVCDADTDDDLGSIARSAVALGTAIVWVGSGGLAHHLPAALGLRPQRSDARAPPAAQGPVLALVGSRSAVAREQARRLAQDPGVTWFELGCDMLLRGEADPGWSSAAARAQRALAEGTDVLLSIELGETVDLTRAPALAAALGRFGAALAGRTGGLIATGGDIARATLAAAGAGGIHLLGEVEPGVPLGVADLEHPLRVVTKAGAFGTPDTLRRCRAALRAAQEE